MHSELENSQSENVEKKDFAVFLQNEFVRRLKNNPRYSMRAFAEFLGIHSGSLSQILKGKRVVSDRQLIKLSERLGFTESEAKSQFTTSNTNNDFSNLNRSYSAEQLTQDTFKIISEWHHFAILEMTLLADFTPDSKWLSKKLGLSEAECLMAVERLKRADLLIFENDAWQARYKNVSTIGMTDTSLALRRMQKSILQKAIDALDEVDVSLRDQSTLTVAINQKDLPKVKDRITEFRRSLNQELGQSHGFDQVYNLTIAFYPLLTPSNSMNVTGKGTNDENN